LFTDRLPEVDHQILQTGSGRMLYTKFQIFDNFGDTRSSESAVLGEANLRIGLKNSEED